MRLFSKFQTCWAWESRHPGVLVPDLPLADWTRLSEFLGISKLAFPHSLPSQLTASPAIQLFKVKAKSVCLWLASFLYSLHLIHQPIISLLVPEGLWIHELRPISSTVTLLWTLIVGEFVPSKYDALQQLCHSFHGAVSIVILLVLGCVMKDLLKYHFERLL